MLSISITNESDVKYLKNQPPTLEGSVSLGLGRADVAYIYIMDTSSAGPGGDCGTVLDCVQEFFIAFNNEAIENGSAKLSSVISFDDSPTLRSGFELPESPLVESAIISTPSVSDSASICSQALLMAADLVEDPSNTAETTVVIFAGDGLCTTQRGGAGANRRHCSHGCCWS